MSGYEAHAAHIIAPGVGDIKSFSSTTTDLVETLTASTLFGSDLDTGGMVTFCAMGADVYIALSSVGDATPAGSLAQSAGWPLKDGVPQAFFLERYRGALKSKIFHVATAACRVHVYRSSSASSESKKP